MVAWWEAMTMVEQIFAVIGIASTLLLIIEVILLIVGFGGHADSDIGGGDSVDIDINDGTSDINIDVDGGGDIHVDMHPGDWYGDSPDVDLSNMTTPESGSSDFGAGTGIHLFTLQGIIAFFSVFGWSGLAMLKSGLPSAASMAIAIALGLLAMLVIALIFRGMMKLQQDGSINIRNALGKSGTVYMRIPAKRENNGKISIVVQEQLIEVNAVTDGEETLRPGTEVTVVGISNNNTLIVRKK